MAADAAKKQTCLQCRKRKVRCDGKIPGCSNCTRLNFSCTFLPSQNIPNDFSSHTAHGVNEYPQTAATTSSRNKYTIGGIERRRGLKACRPCRVSKSRCSGGWPKCRHCEQRGLDCQYMPSKRRKGAIDPGQVQPFYPAKVLPRHMPSDICFPTIGDVPDITQLPGCQNEHPRPVRSLIKSNLKPNSNFNLNLDLSLDLPANKIFLEFHINAYLEYINPIPAYSFIHKPSFLRKFHHDKLDSIFLGCVCGIASRFLERDNPRQDYVSEWLKEVEGQMWPRMAEMKIENLQILLLLICWYSLDRKISNMWTSSAMAARIAYGMRLNCESTDAMPFISKEVRRRMMWSIFMLDKFYSGGFAELTLSNVSTMHLNLPCDERNFELDIPTTTATLTPTSPSGTLESGIGLMGHMSRLVKIRHEVLEVTKRIISSKESPYEAKKDIQALDANLHDFAHSLPNHLQNNKRNLLSRAYTTELTGYITLHSLWIQCHCDLYRMMIPGIRESVPEHIQRDVPFDYAEECRELCLQYAIDMCRLWSVTLLECDLSRITDQSLGIYAYQCANILVKLWDLDADTSLRDYLMILSNFLERLSAIYQVVAEIQFEINGFVDSLDVVTNFYATRGDELFSQSLTEIWRSSLKQQSAQEGQTTSKFSLLEFLQQQNKSDGSPSEEYPDAVEPSGDGPENPHMRADEGLHLDVDIASVEQTEELSNDFWSTSLNMDFDSYDTRVDPFCRMFDDWALVEP